MKNNTHSIKPGVVIWIIGPPAAGKSSLATKLAQKLKINGASCSLLDSDIMRKEHINLGYSASDRRLALNNYISSVQKDLFHDVVICSSVTYSNELQKMARDSFNRFVEVYLKCSVDECIRRDAVGPRSKNNFYQQAISGSLKNFVGVDLKFEEPDSPELVIDTEIVDPVSTLNEAALFLSEFHLTSHLFGNSS